MTVSGTPDEIDMQIIDLLRVNARESATDIGTAVGLTAGAVRRRIGRLEEAEIIAGYTVRLNHDRLDSTVEAYVELSFAGHTNVHEILVEAMKRPEVREAMTIAGEPDALVRLRVNSLTDLREAVMALRTSGSVTASKTRIVLGRRWHGSVQELEGFANKDDPDQIRTQDLR